MSHLAAFGRVAALRQKLPLAGSKSNFRFTPESRLNSEIAACPKSAAARTSQNNSKSCRKRRKHGIASANDLVIAA